MILRKDSEEPVVAHLGSVDLEGTIHLPEGVLGVVLFAHASSDAGLRNRSVARSLRAAGLGTVVIDLLTSEENRSYPRRFDITLLAERLGMLTDWLRQRIAGTGLRIGTFGVSTGAAAALRAAVDHGGSIAAIVCRGGRPDLADEVLPEVEAPTLFIVGGNDEPVTSLNVSGYQRLRCPKELAVIPGATHLFEQPGALDEVSRLAAGWFRRHLPAPP